MEKKLDLKELLEEYQKVVNNIPVDEIESENKILASDIRLLERDIEGLDKRIDGIRKEQEELEASISNFAYAENIETIKEAIGKAIAEKQNSIAEIIGFKEKKSAELRKKQEQKLENEKKIKRVEEIGPEVIEKAELKTKAANMAIDEEIKKLEERQNKYGIAIEKDEEGNAKKKQLTSEEKLVVENIQKEIDALKKQKKVNVRKLESFKKMINIPKEKNKVEPAVAEPTVGEPAVGEPAVGEPAVGEPTVAEPTVAEPTVGEPAVAEPTVGEPTVGEPTVAEPAVGEPTVGEPAVTEPAVAEPTIAEPAVAEPTVAEPAVAEPTVAEPAENLNRNSMKINITPGKYIIIYNNSSVITYSNDDTGDRNLDMSFDRKSEREYRKVLQEQYPELSKGIIKKLDLGLLKVLEEINPDLREIYIKSIEEGEKLKGLPEIKYFEEIESTATEREAYVARRNARNNRKVAENGIKSSLWIRIKDGATGFFDKFMDGFEDMSETKALEAGDPTRNIETEVADQTENEPEKELTIQEQVKVKELTQEEQARQAQERADREAVEDNSIGRQAQLASQEAEVDIDAIIEETREYSENPEGAEYTVDDIIAEVKGEER